MSVDDHRVVSLAPTPTPYACHAVPFRQPGAHMLERVCHGHCHAPRVATAPLLCKALFFVAADVLFGGQDPLVPLLR